MGVSPSFEPQFEDQLLSERCLWPPNSISSPLKDTSRYAKMVKTLPFGDIEVPVPGFGAMGLNHGFGTNFTLEEAEPILLKALELGCTFWDTAVSPMLLLPSTQPQPILHACLAHHLSTLPN